MKIQFTYIPDHQLYIQKYSGIWSTEEYMPFVRKNITSKEWADVTKILTDLREVNFESTLNSLHKLAEFRSKVVAKNYLNVQLISDPHSTAIVHLYQSELSARYKYAYCSTLKHAIELLNLKGKITESEMENILMNLELHG
jgi:hypothetical protein